MAKLIWIWKLIINQKNASGSKSWRQIYIFYGKCPQISQNVVNFLTGTKFFVTCFHKWAILDNIRKFVDAIASPSTYPCQSVGEWVIDSFRFGDSYRMSELCELINHQSHHPHIYWITSCSKGPPGWIGIHDNLCQPWMIYQLTIS